METMIEPLKKYAEFTGRARRQEYWMFYLFTMIVVVVLEVLSAALGGTDPSTGEPGVLGTVFMGLLFIFLLALFIPSLAVAFRRLHDTNRSAWWLLIGLIPFLGAIVLLVFYCLDGTPGPNRFGPDPKGRSLANTAETFA